MSRDVLQSGLLQGRLPGRKDFYGYYLELTSTQFHIFDGQDSDMRKHLLSLRIDSSDTAGVETRVRKGEFRFYLDRPGDGKYIFKVPTEADREEWIRMLQRVINKETFEKMDGFQVPPADAFSPDNVGHQAGVPTRVDIPSVPKTPPTTSRTFDSRTLPGKSRNGNKSVLNSTLPPPPVMGGSSFSQSSPRASVISTVSTDSGIGTSVGGEVRRPSLHKAESRSMPNSGSGIVSRDLKMGHSADAEFRHGVKVCDEDMPKWFWGTMNRQDCEDQLKEKGEIGNFVVRVNATGHHIMSFWRVDGVHHHKILHHEGIWRFEKAAVSAEGESLADLLDTYMKNCTKDKNIKPFGGGLFDNYTYAWAPKELDLELLGKKLRDQKERREKHRKPRRKQEYTPVEVDTGLDDEKGGFENDGEEPVIRVKNKPLPLPPNKGKSSPPTKSSPDRSGPSPSPSPSPRPGSASSKTPSPAIKPKVSKANAPAPPTKPGKTDGSQLSESDKPGLSASGGRPGSTGLALLQEINEKRRANLRNKKAQRESGIGTPTHTATPASSVPPHSVVDPGQADGTEAVYANIMELSQGVTGSGYENHSFDGPPPPTTTTAVGSGAPPPAAPAPGEPGSEYQNFQFLVQKKQQGPPQTRKKPAKSTKLSVGVSPDPSSSPSLQVKGHGYLKSGAGTQSPSKSPVVGGGRKTSAHVNGSVTNNSAGEYQNFEFGKPAVGQRH